MGIYEETYEKIAYRVKQGDEKKNKTTLIPEGVDDDEALVRRAQNLDQGYSYFKY